MNKLALAALLLFSVQPAFAGQTLDFEQLKDACRNPAKYHSQVQPTGIKVDCADRQLKWVPSSPDKGDLSCHRLVGFSISSDKYTVPMNKAGLDLPAVGTECPTFKQIEETVNTSQNLTCEQLLNFKGTAVDLCQQMLDQARLDNPQALNVQETGKVHHLCAQASVDKGIQGEKQAQGNKGIQGEKQAQGNKGVQGEKQAQGNKGVQGEKQAQGDKGIQQGKQERGQRQVQGKQERGQRGAAQQQGNRPATGNQSGNQSGGQTGNQPSGDQPTDDQPSGDQPSTGEHRLSGTEF